LVGDSDADWLNLENGFPFKPVYGLQLIVDPIDYRIVLVFEQIFRTNSDLKWVIEAALIKSLFCPSNVGKTGSETGKL
jgi:hypothetical protein